VTRLEHVDIYLVSSVFPSRKIYLLAPNIVSGFFLYDTFYLTHKLISSAQNKTDVVHSFPIPLVFLGFPVGAY
jgi:hypothetical protein